MAQDSAVFSAQLARMKSGKGFIAALDQSGGSTPKALKLYGVEESEYSGEEAMYGEIHAMRSRIILSPDFTSEKVLGAILFERTMRAEVNSKPTAALLWEDRGIVPFLKIDKGLEDQANGVQLMKAMPGLEALLSDAVGFGIFGTKERSVIHEANSDGIAAVVAQQFDIAKIVIAAGLVPIIEPEVDIHSETKSKAEEMLRDEILKHLDLLGDGQDVMLKLTIPNEANIYDVLADHPKVVRVVALSGGYSTEDACAKLQRNGKMIASFSRALTEGLSKRQTDVDFDVALGGNIDKIYRAS